MPEALAPFAAGMTDFKSPEHCNTQSAEAACHPAQGAMDRPRIKNGRKKGAGKGYSVQQEEKNII